jgi:peptidoglycan hydrolase-like protein with peptidoglycan-binding domain
VTETREVFARALLADPKVVAAGIPDTEQNVLAFVAVMSGENTKAANNPCATTWPMPGATPFNTIPTSGGGADGVDATVSTLLEVDEKGEHTYGPIITALVGGNDAQGMCEAWAVSPWGTTDAVRALALVEANPAPFYAAPIGEELAPPGPAAPPAPPAPPEGSTPPEGTTPAPPAQPTEVPLDVPELSVTSPGPGEVSGAVKTVQAKLALIGHGGLLGPTGSDGRFGPNTENAVKSFQATHGLTVDGVVGAATWPAIVDA